MSAFILLNLATQPACDVKINSQIDGATINYSPNIDNGTLETGETVIGNGGMFVSGCCNNIDYESTILVHPNLA